MPSCDGELCCIWLTRIVEYGSFTSCMYVYQLVFSSADDVVVDVDELVSIMVRLLLKFYTPGISMNLNQVCLSSFLCRHQ